MVPVSAILWIKEKKYGKGFFTRKFQLNMVNLSLTGRLVLDEIVVQIYCIQSRWDP